MAWRLYTKSNTGVPKLDFPPNPRLSAPQPPSTPKPDSSSVHTPQPSVPAPVSPKDKEQALSSIILRANSGRSGAPPPSSMMPSGSEPAPSRSPMARPSTTFMTGANQSNVPWLQELNAKQQKRKSQNIEPGGGKDGDPPAPPVSAKPSVPGSAKPTSKLPSSPQPQPDTASAKQTSRTLASKQFGGSQQQKSTVASQQQDAVDSTKTSKQQQQQQSTTPTIKAQQHHTPVQSAPTASIQPEVELRRPSGLSQPSFTSSVQPNVQVRRTPSTSSQHSSSAASQPDVQQLRKPLTEPDVISSASSSRKSSAVSTSAAVSSAAVAAVSAAKLDGAASSAASSRTASIAEGSEPARVLDSIPTAAVVRAAHESSSISSVSQAPAPSQPSVNTDSLAAAADTSSTSTTASSPIPSAAKSAHTQSASVPHPSNSPSSHPPPKKHSDSGKASSVSSNPVIPKDVSEDSKALDNVNAILNKLLPKVSALETRLEEQKHEHTRQLNLLMSELDDERKKRACLEIEMERLRKMLLTYTTHV